MKKFLREPLLHFLMLGAALFAVWFWKQDAAAGDSHRIVVTQARIRQLTTGFARTQKRPPTDQELEGLHKAYVAAIRGKTNMKISIAREGATIEV